MLVQLQHLMIFFHNINFVELLQSPFFTFVDRSAGFCPHHHQNSDSAVSTWRGERDAIKMEPPDFWLGLDSDVVPADVGLRLQHQQQQHHHHHHHHRHHHHGCNVTCRAVPGEVEAIIMEINHRLIRRGARWENASQGWRRSVWTTSHFRCCAVDPNNTSPHSSHLPTLTILHAIIHTWLERHLHYKTLCLCSFPQQWHPPRNINNIFCKLWIPLLVLSTLIFQDIKSLSWLGTHQYILRLSAQYSIQPASIFSATLLL